jgi:hypothetical protein
LHFSKLPLYPVWGNGYGGRIDPKIGKVTPAGKIEEIMAKLDNDDIEAVADKVVSKLLNYNNTTRTDRNFYALNIDAGLNATITRDRLNSVIGKLDALSAVVVGLNAGKNVDAIIEEIRKINIELVVSKDDK